MTKNFIFYFPVTLFSSQSGLGDVQHRALVGGRHPLLRRPQEAPVQLPVAIELGAHLVGGARGDEDGRGDAHEPAHGLRIKKLRCV